MSGTRSRELEWLNKYYKSLEGCVIEKVEIVSEDDFGYPEDWPTLTCRRPDGEQFVVEVSKDPEGNGAGFLFGLEQPVMEDA